MKYKVLYCVAAATFINGVKFTLVSVIIKTKRNASDFYNFFESILLFVDVFMSFRSFLVCLRLLS